MKHILDWYNENTPQNEDEYEKGGLNHGEKYIYSNGEVQRNFGSL